MWVLKLCYCNFSLYYVITQAPLNRPSATIDKLKLKQPNVASSIGKSAKARSEKLQTSENIANTARSSTPDMFAKQMVGAKNYSTVASESMFQPLGNDSINLSAIAPLQYGGHSSATIGPGFAGKKLMKIINLFKHSNVNNNNK